MPSANATGAETAGRPYRSLREDPRYHELKRIIDNLSTEKMDKLKTYIKKWSRDA
ncbi:hypothetical protein ACFL2Q_17620 [Thermodesulfobacteriota bacterium]